MKKLNITVFQNDTIWENPELNLKEIKHLILSNLGANLYILPEMFNTGFTSNVEEFAENEDGYTLKYIKEIAEISKAAICGSILLKKEGCYFNSFVFVKPDGQIIKYNKRHIFKIGMESELISSGTERVVVEYFGIRFLLQICYDLRFPVWSRNKDDYDVIIYVANWPASRRSAFDILLKARAIENIAYVIANNRIGRDGNNIYYNGGSQIINYKGEQLAVAIDNEKDIINMTIDLDELKEYKNIFPAHLDKDDFKIII